jgi:hypothetical protein
MFPQSSAIAIAIVIALQDTDGSLACPWALY